jgi:hypothetical protein
MATLRSTVGDERGFQNWFEGHRKAKRTGKVYDPDEDYGYNWREAYKAGARPDDSGNWPSQYKKGK